VCSPTTTIGDSSAFFNFCCGLTMMNHHFPVLGASRTVEVRWLGLDSSVLKVQLHTGAQTQPADVMS
jgi:hypothetical protein